MTNYDNLQLLCLRLAHNFLVLLIGVVINSTPSLAQGDALEEPSAPSKMASHSLLLDIELVKSKLIAVGERGHILISNDQAGSWAQAQVPVRSTLTASFFSDEKNGWVVGHDGVVLRTNDGGLSWVKQLDGRLVNRLMYEHAKMLFDETEAVMITATDDQLKALELRLENLTTTIEDAESFIDEGPSRPFLDIWFKNSLEGFIVGAFGLFLHTQDGGESWTPWFDKLDLTDAFHLNVISRIGESLYIAGEAGLLYRSDDWGQSWNMLESPYEGPFFGAVEAGEHRVIVYGLRGNAFTSSDQGNTWRAIETGTDASLFGGLRLDDGSVVLVGVGGTVLRLSDQGILKKRTQTTYKLPLSAVAQIDTKLVATGFGGIQPLVPDRKQQGVRP
ncbi:MAG: YCF48-related protein [Candidatus Thiodiazotropha sp.]